MTIDLRFLRKPWVRLLLLLILGIALASQTPACQALDAPIIPIAVKAAMKVTSSPDTVTASPEATTWTEPRYPTVTTQEPPAVPAEIESCAVEKACRPTGLPFDHAPAVVGCRFRDPHYPAHSGVDFPLPEFTEVRATHDGVVIRAEAHPAYGNLVVVANPFWSTWYAHNAYLLVREGDAIRRGDLLALSGSTGASTGPHLHYEIRDALGNPRNPLKFMDVDLPFTPCRSTP